MASRRTCTHSHGGYTLIELLIVVALIIMLIGLSFFIDLHNYLGDAFRSERNTVVTVLQTARADALNNVGELPHGVAIHPADHPTSYVIFAGDRYETSDPSTRQVFDATYQATFNPGAPSEIVFCQLSGDATTGIAEGTRCEDGSNAFDGTIAITDPIRQLTFNIALNHEGAISW